MNKDKKIIASIHKVINEDNCKSIMNLNINGLPEFENLPGWFINHCTYTANLIRELRLIVLENKNILSDEQYNEYLLRHTKDSNINNLL